MIAIGVLVGLIWVVSMIGNTLPQAPIPPSTETSAPSANAGQAFQNPRDVTGAPVSADDFLSRR